MNRIETDTFILELLPKIHEQDLLYPVNVNLGVKVSSYGVKRRIESGDSDVLISAGLPTRQRSRIGNNVLLSA